MLTGMKEFRRFLQQKRSELASTPILLIDSFSTGDSSTELLKHVELYCSAVGLRTATTHPSSGHFPFAKDMVDTIELARRTGAGTVIGVGASGAVELAKAVAQEKSEIEHLILVPEDYGSTLFASTSHGLILDPKESALLPAQTKSLRDVASHIVLSDLSNPSKNDPEILKATIYTGLVLALDELYRGCNDEDEIMRNIHLASDLIDKSNNSEGLAREDSRKLLHLMVNSGSAISFGLATNKACTIRSVPLALSTSLLTTAFPDYDFFGFTSCFLPGLLSVLEGTKHNCLAMELSSRFIYRCPRISKSSGDDLDLQTLMSLVHSNMDLWGCDDVEDDTLKQVLRTSLDLQ